MARVTGVDLPKNKRIDVALCYLHGVGKARAKEVMVKLSGVVKPDVRVKDLTEQHQRCDRRGGLEIDRYRAIVGAERVRK